MKQILNNRKFRLCIQLLFMYTWLANLANTDSFLTVYMLCALLGALCLWDNLSHSYPASCWSHILTWAVSALYGIAVILANYPLFQPVASILSLFNIGCTLLGGTFIAYNILVFSLRRLPITYKTSSRISTAISPAAVFVVSFLIIAAVFMAYMLTTGYPVYLAHDSIVSMKQLETGIYTNHHPYWYTRFIGFGLSLGRLFSTDPNVAAAAYSTVQILILSACFAYSLVTLYQASIPPLFLLLCLGTYAFLPYNLTYSITMWKDTLFGGCTLAAISALYRIIHRLGKKQWLNYLVFIISSIGFCLVRNNGLPVYLVWILFLILFLGKKHKKFLIICLLVLLFCWIMTGPVLTALNVQNTEIVEVLSVPLQQIARVIASDLPISEDELSMIEKFFDIALVKENYTPYIVDPIKFESLSSGAEQYLSENFGEFLKVWIKLGMKYPGTYLEAWVEVTKGFWNGGYYYWIYFRGTYPETTGIGGFEMNNPGKSLFDALFRYTEKPVILQPLYSIGLQVWILFGCCYITFIQKRRDFLISIPLLVLSAVLWVMTPVYAEFRYAYPMFTTCLFILLTTVYASDKPAELDK